MENNIINTPEFSSTVLPYLNYADDNDVSLDALRDMFMAIEKIITIHRIINNSHRIIDNLETRERNLGSSNKVVLSEIIKGLSDDKKKAFLKSEELKHLVEIDPPIEEMSIYNDNGIFPEQANSNLKILTQKKHLELKRQYEQYIERNSGQTKLIKKISSVLSMVRNNIAHGEKTPMGPDMNFNHRNKLIINVFIPFIKDVFFELLFNSPKNRICLYGTLRKGKSNYSKSK